MRSSKEWRYKFQEWGSTWLQHNFPLSQNTLERGPEPLDLQISRYHTLGELGSACRVCVPVAVSHRAVGGLSYPSWGFKTGTKHNIHLLMWLSDIQRSWAKRIKASSYRAHFESSVNYNLLQGYWARSYPVKRSTLGPILPTDLCLHVPDRIMGQLWLSGKASSQ
jgi:hypothetical protein